MLHPMCPRASRLASHVLMTGRPPFTHLASHLAPLSQISIFGQHTFAVPASECKMLAPDIAGEFERLPDTQQRLGEGPAIDFLAGLDALPDRDVQSLGDDGYGGVAPGLRGVMDVEIDVAGLDQIPHRRRRRPHEGDDAQPRQGRWQRTGVGLKYVRLHRRVRAQAKLHGVDKKD